MLNSFAWRRLELSNAQHALSPLSKIDVFAANKHSVTMALHRVVLQNQINPSARQFQQCCQKLLVPQLNLERQYPLREPGCLFSMEITPDGGVLATTAEYIQLRDVHTGRLLCDLSGHEETVTSLAFFHTQATSLHSPPSSDYHQPSVNYDSLDSDAEDQQQDMDIETAPAHEGEMYDSEVQEHRVYDSCHNQDIDSHWFFSSSLDKTIKLWKGTKAIATLTEHHDWIRCLSINCCNRMLVSGCVSSVITGWDITTLRPTFRLPEAHCPRSYVLNAINSLEFSHEQENVFVSGARDGLMKLWDARCIHKGATLVRKVHASKVNCIKYSQDDRYLLSGGRDNSTRLWDVRSLHPDANPIRQYDKHLCANYNVSSAFLCNDQFVLSGSEDGKVYLYDTKTAEVLCTMNGHSTVAHLVLPHPTQPLTFFSNSIANCTVNVWSPQPPSNPEQIKTESLDPQVLENFRAVQHLMQTYGDRVLKAFHQSNFRFSRVMNANFNSISDDHPDNEETRRAHEEIEKLVELLSAAFNSASEEMSSEMSQDEPESADDETDTFDALSSLSDNFKYQNNTS